MLEGSYEPPGGVVGRLFDRVVGQKLAARTMDALLDQLAHQFLIAKDRDSACRRQKERMLNVATLTPT